MGMVVYPARQHRDQGMRQAPATVRKLQPNCYYLHAISYRYGYSTQNATTQSQTIGRQTLAIHKTFIPTSKVRRIPITLVSFHCCTHLRCIRSIGVAPRYPGNPQPLLVHNTFTVRCFARRSADHPCTALSSQIAILALLTMNRQ